MAHGGKRTAGEGKKIGRPEKPKIDQFATSRIASDVLGMDGPPDHVRKCSCHICVRYPKNCACIVQCGDCGKLEENCECEKHRPFKIECLVCRTVEEHKVCHCEVCGWWQPLLARDVRLRKETRQYLTDRRDGKPAQGVFVGDTRERARELDFGDLPELITSSQSQSPRKPN